MTYLANRHSDSAKSQWKEEKWNKKKAKVQNFKQYVYFFLLILSFMFAAYVLGSYGSEWTFFFLQMNTQFQLLHYQHSKENIGAPKV